MNMLGSAVAGIAAFLGFVASVLMIAVAVPHVDAWWPLVLAWIIFFGMLGRLAWLRITRTQPVAVRSTPVVDPLLPATPAFRRGTLRVNHAFAGFYATMPRDDSDPSDSLAISDENEDYDDDWNSLR